ncbi:MAG: hypothetical protein HY914_20010 [Desulfomonile tiedjei]|nr:hypothetical protein [Desulfomonile tiedjei]
MEIDTYCEKVAVELSGWKAKIDEIVFKLDQISTGDKSAVVPQVNELHMIVEELGDRIEKFRAECPVAAETEEAGIKIETFHGQKPWQGVWENVSPGEIGG